jgi:multidrug efflux pump subunit AcrB
MWIVRVALDRPYTFIVLALMILITSVVVISRTPTDIFPSIDIPVVAVDWTFTGLNPEEMEGRLTSVYERALTTTVDNIQHLESTTVNGQAIVKIFLQPGASLDTANDQVTAISQNILRQLPPGTLPPLIINYSASSVPILQLGLAGLGLSEQQLNDLGQNFLRPQLVTVPGAVIPYPYGGKQRQVMINLVPRLMQAKGVSPTDVLSAVTNQNLVLPSGTAKIGEFEYDTPINDSPRTLEGVLLGLLASMCAQADKAKGTQPRWVIVLTITDPTTGALIKQRELDPELAFDDPIKCKSVAARAGPIRTIGNLAVALTCRKVDRKDAVLL